MPDCDAILQTLRHLLKLMYPSERALELEEQLHIGESLVKTIFIHAFMDEHTFEVDRIKKCCTHYALPDGRLMPGCAYNMLLPVTRTRVYTGQVGTTPGLGTDGMISDELSNPPRLLAGKKVLVTGGSRGLGRALCLAFTKHGAETAFTWNRNQSAAEETVALCAGAGTPPIHFRAPVLDSPAIAAMVKELEQRWGRIDILVNNAAVSQNLPLALMEEADWDFVMDTNVKGTFLMSRSVLRGMFYRKTGVILTIYGSSGWRADDRGTASPLLHQQGRHQRFYRSAGQGGVTSQRPRALSCTWSARRRRGTETCPDHKRDDYLRHCALGRVGTFAEVAEFAAFLVSDQNSYQNGATVVMDGCV